MSYKKLFHHIQIFWDAPVKRIFLISNGGLGSAQTVNLRFESMAKGSRVFKDTPLFLMYLHTRAVKLLYKWNITQVAVICLYIIVLWLHNAESQPCWYENKKITNSIY